MSENKSDAQPQAKLTKAQKETARRLQISEADYAKATAELIKRGKIQQRDIP